MFRRRFPNHLSPPLSPGESPTLQRTLYLNDYVQKQRKSFSWGMVNIALLFGILYDLTNKCPSYNSWFHYAEYVALITFLLNTVYHLIRYIYCTFKAKAIMATMQNNDLSEPTGSDDDDVDSANKTTEMSSSPGNWSANSWGSDTSSNQNQSYSLLSGSWEYYPGSMNRAGANLPIPAFPDTSGVNDISDENSLKRYLENYDLHERSYNATNSMIEQNSFSMFWNNSASQNPSDSGFMKINYQTAPQISLVTSTGINDESSALNISSSGLDIWRNLDIDTKTLTQWNFNLRMWLSQTILERLIKEITFVNEELGRYHLNEVRIGNVGLERLRKTAQTMPVVQFVPSLSTLLTFLEVTPNQEYLVKRIKDLTRGGCMTDFKWNGGGSYDGKQWDDTLITDTQILMHLLATYLDCQLVQFPNHPESKVFSKEHYIRLTDKVPKNPSTLAIHQVAEKPPHFQLIVGEDIYEVAKGHNNFFHTILLFLYFVSKRESGMLAKVNMGQAGVNMLWIIGKT